MAPLLPQQLSFYNNFFLSYVHLALISGEAQLRVITLAAVACAALVTASHAAMPAPSTSDASIAKVMEMLDRAPTNAWKQIIVTAYRAGLDQAADLMIGGDDPYSATITCPARTPLT